MPPIEEEDPKEPNPDDIQKEPNRLDDVQKEPELNGSEDWEAKYKALLKHSREWEKKAKANKDAADALKEEKDRRAWEREIEKETGVPADVLASISAESRDDLAEKAEGIKAHFAKDTVPVVPGDGLRPGKVTSSKQEFARDLFGRS